MKPKEIHWFVQRLAERKAAGEDAGFESGVFVLMSRFKNPEKVLAISERMRCLAKIMKDPRMRGFAIQSPDDPGCTYTHGAVFTAAALCKLLLVDDHVGFDLDEFFALALEHRSAEGTT